MRYENLTRHNSNIHAKNDKQLIGKCPKCGNDLVIKNGKYGKFVACSNYEECNYMLDNNINEKCPECGGNLSIQESRKGRNFIRCENYPSCRYAKWYENENAQKNISTQGINVNNNEDYINQFKKGTREDIQEDVMSSWEANIIRLFNYLNIEYKYESELYDLDKYNCDYKFASPCYIPDFKLENGTLIEVKGNFDYRSLQNMKRFKELYPNEKIIVIDRDIYYLLEKKYSDLIETWEQSSNALTCYLDVVGITFKERKQYVDRLKEGEEILIVRELDNKYDKNAIKVLDKDNNHLGYISSDYACYYAPKIDKGIKYSLKVKEIKEKTLKCAITPTNLDIYDVSNFFELF